MGSEDKYKYAYIDRKNSTFSGSDTLAFIILPNTAPIVLGSLSTFSYSSYRAKKPVSTLGSVLSRGTAKGGRIIAGTLIFTLINQHWVNELIDQVEWLRNSCEGVVYSDELPLFDIMIISANEYGKHISMKIQGVNLTDEAGTLSINDAYSENSFSFIAREIRTFNDKRNITQKDMTYSSHKLFTGFNTNKFNPSFVKRIYNNKYYDGKDFFDFIKNTVISLDDDVFIDVVNNLVDLGFKFEEITNTNATISEAIFDIINNVYGDSYPSIFDFLNNGLPYLDKPFYETNRFYTVEGDGVKFFSNKSLDIQIDLIDGDVKIPVFSEYINDFGETVYYTEYGWVSSDYVVEKNTTTPIGSTDSLGITNMNAVAKIGNNLIDKDTTIIDFNSSFELTDEFTLSITTNSEEYVKAISSIVLINDDNEVAVTEEIILNGVTTINFKDKEDIIKTSNAKSGIIVIKEIEYDHFFSLRFTIKDGGIVGS